MLDVPQALPPALSSTFSLPAVPRSVLGGCCAPRPAGLHTSVPGTGRPEHEPVPSASSRAAGMLACQMKLSAFAAAPQQGDNVVPLKADK